MANNNGQYVYDGFIARGFTPVQAAVLAGNMQQESSFNPNAYNANEDAFGGLQWRLDRKTGLEAYAKATGRPAGDLDAQMDWVVQEMLGPEARNAAAFLSATTPEAAQAGIKKYIRWGDASDNKRLQNAMAYMGTPAPGAAVQAIDTATNTPANALMGDSGFVNPAWGNSPFQMPNPNAMAPAPVAPAAAPAIAPPAQQETALPAPTASDDELLRMFLSPTEGVGSPSAAPTEGGLSADDEFLRHWLPDVAEAPVPADPVMQEAFADASRRSQTLNLERPSGVSGILKQALANVPVIAPVANLLMSDSGQAFGRGVIDAIPIAGPALANARVEADALLAQLPGGMTPEEVRTKADAYNAALKEEHGAETLAGNIAGTVLPFMGVGATALGAKALGMSAEASLPIVGNLGARMLAGGLSGGAISGADTLARGGSVEEAGKNALTGLAIGGAVPAAGAVVNNLIAPAVSPRVAQLAQLARDRFGIAVSPAQLSSNRLVRFMEDIVNQVPLSGGTVSREGQQAAFNRAVANTFGENADALTADVLEAASTRIGNVFDDVAARTPRIAADPAFDQQMLDAMTTAQQTLTDAELVPLTRQFDALVGKFQQGGNAIDGATYQALTRKGTPLDLALNSPNPNIRQVAGEFREALDGALERSAAPDVLADLQTARAQWKALKTVQRLAEKGPIGDVSPALLQNAVIASYKGMPTAGVGNDLTELARIGQQFLKAPPSSGTAERLAIMNLLTKGGAAAGGLGALALNPGMIIPAALGAAGTLGAGRLLGTALRSPQLANMLINNGIRGAAARGNALIPPAAVPLLSGEDFGNRPPLRIVVDGANPLPVQ